MNEVIVRRIRRVGPRESGEGGHNEPASYRHVLSCLMMLSPPRLPTPIPNEIFFIGTPKRGAGSQDRCRTAGLSATGSIDPHLRSHTALMGSTEMETLTQEISSVDCLVNLDTDG